LGQPTSTIFTIAEVTRYVKGVIENDPQCKDIWVQGEISNFKLHTSGHMYFTLKDESSSLKSVMFKWSANSLRFKPADGMKVLLRGNITIYEASGQYQINAKEMQPDGIGSLHLAFEQLKEKLAKEGLFDVRHKQELPAYPKTIGIITSPTGAAVRDIITTLQRRYPIAKLVLIPVLVQGEGAAPDVVRAIERFNAHGEADVLIVGRGGGSIEDLWAFNEEIVARAIFASKIPIISAVGHETDTTIADFVADHRAPTPTGAAEMAAPHIDELRQRVAWLRANLERNIKNKMTLVKQNTTRLHQSLLAKSPQRLLHDAFQRSDAARDRLELAMDRLLKDKRAQLSQDDKLKHLMLRLIERKRREFAVATAKLDGLSPLKIMSRGYSLVYSEGGLLTTAENVNVGSEITLELTDATLVCQVNDKKEKSR
jgi:exodeoxyribonuclease VII large subunit